VNYVDFKTHGANDKNYRRNIFIYIIILSRLLQSEISSSSARTLNASNSSVL